MSLKLSSLPHRELGHVMRTTRGSIRSSNRARPTLFRPLQLLAPIAVAGLVFIARAPLPAAAALPPPPGTTQVQMKEVEGLKQIAKLNQLDARDDAQRERLDKIARDAEKL